MLTRYSWTWAGMREGWLARWHLRAVHACMENRKTGRQGKRTHRTCTLALPDPTCRYLLFIHVALKITNAAVGGDWIDDRDRT